MRGYVPRFPSWRPRVPRFLLLKEWGLRRGAGKEERGFGPV